MGFASLEERDELVDLIAQAVIDRIEERDKINGLADMVVARVFSLQREEDELMSKRSNPLLQDVASYGSETQSAE